MKTKELIDRIFKEPGVKFELTEFENLGKPIHDIIAIYPKVAATGKDAGKIKYYLKSFIPFASGNEEVHTQGRHQGSGKADSAGRAGSKNAHESRQTGVAAG